MEYKQEEQEPKKEEVKKVEVEEEKPKGIFWRRKEEVKK